MFKRFTISENRFSNLRKLNLVMGVFHLLQGLLMLALSNDFAVKLTKTFLSSEGTSSRNFTIYPETSEFLSLTVGPAVASFLFLSAIAHFLLVLPGIYEWYVNNLKKNSNPARWLEYALSSSIMIVLISALVGFFDAPGLILVFSLNAMMNLFGLLQEKLNRDGNKGKVDWTAFIFGCIAGIIPWIVVAWYFISAVNGFKGENPIPDFVYAILITLFVTFNIFAVNMFLYYKKIGPWKNYLFGEVIYIVLSLFAKSLLAWQVWSGTLRPE